MSTVASVIAPEAPGKTGWGIEPAQRTAARVAGVLYLFTTAASAAELIVRDRLVVAGDAALTASNLQASERLFRVCALLNASAVLTVVLAVALYFVLRSVNGHLALLAMLWRLGECVVLAVVTVNDIAALSLLGGAEYLRAFDAPQLQALAYTFLRVQAGGYWIGLVFYGLGSALFAYLWLVSRYIPRWLSVLGIFSALVVGVGASARLVFPGIGVAVLAISGPPGVVFEIGLGVWLLVKGLRAPRVA